MAADSERVAVVGPGRMGIGIAQALALAGRTVKLIDVKPRSADESKAALEVARARVAEGLSLLGSIGLDVDGALQRVEYCSVRDADAVLARCDVVFEAVPETAAAKESAYHRIGATDALIGSTTSTFAVEHLAGQLRDRSRFMNTHWLNPAPLMPLVEVMPGVSTSEAAVEQMVALLRGIGKVPARCAPSAGYIVPRIQAVAMNEAARLVEEGVADPATIDLACRLGFGVRFATMGLLEFADWGGVDILLHAGTYLTRALASERYAPPGILVAKAEAGDLGMGSRRGFYNFEERDLEEYRRETLRALVDVLEHLGFGPRTRRPDAPSEGEG